MSCVETTLKQRHSAGIENTGRPSYGRRRCEVFAPIGEKVSPISMLSMHLVAISLLTMKLGIQRLLKEHFP